MSKKFEIAKGNRDWYGKDAVIRNKVRDILRKVFERYGYVPLETPILEYKETLYYKGGSEIQKEVFTLQDQGKRDLGLRFDQTVPLGRFVATHPEIKFPFKRYVIGEVFRDGPAQPEQGRYRGFTQCDVDILGVKEMTAEAELLALAQDAFLELKLGDVEVKINNRKVLDGLLDAFGLPESAKMQAIITIDKLDKIGIEGVKDELVSFSEVFNSDVNNSQKISPESINKLIEVFEFQGSNEEKYDFLSKIINSVVGKDGLKEIKQLLDYTDVLGFDFVKLDPSLARGLNYYTGTTIEVYLKDKKIIKSAILAGGRYDNMIGEFKDANEEIPAVGFSFGLERLVTILSQTTTVDGIRPSLTDIYLIPIGSVEKCLQIAHDLRKHGVNVDMALQNKTVGKCINYADKAQIPYVGVVGENELKDNSITIKSLSSREQKTVKLEDAPKYILRGEKNE